MGTHRRRGKLGNTRPDNAETGTPSDTGHEPASAAAIVDKSVETAGYPRRIWFSPVAELGSHLRRFGFAATQNQVRITAEMGTQNSNKTCKIMGLQVPYTVYK
jgi:hypothetical protein